MPDSLDQLPLDQQMALSDADPELHALLGNTATASLEMAALNGTLAEVALTPQERHNAEIQAEIQRLIASEPWGRKDSYVPDPDAPMGQRLVPGHKGNLTAQLRLKELAPEQAMVLEAAAKPPVANPGALTEEGAAFVNAQLGSMQAAGMGRVE